MKTLEQWAADAVDAAIWAADAADSASEGLGWTFDCDNARQSADDALEEACATRNTELNNVSDVKR